MRATKVLIALVLSAIAFLLPDAVSANHVIYTVDDLDSQKQDVPNLENYDFKGWATGAYATNLRWWADADSLPYANYVIPKWTSAIPQLTWAQDSALNADAKIRHVPCPFGEPGCIVRLSGWWYYDPVRDANYWTKAEARVNWGTGPGQYNMSEAGKRGAYAHEIGHLYGLGEMYDEDNPACNNLEYSVMDTLYPGSGGQLYHCDALTGPSTDDDARATTYWSTGQSGLVEFTATASGTVGTYTWKDPAWAEYDQVLYWYWWDGSLWQLYRFLRRQDDVGTMVNYDPGRVLTEVVDRLDYPNGGNNGPGVHIACGWAYHVKFASVGPWTCSNQIELQ